MALTPQAAASKDATNGRAPVTFEHRHFARIAMILKHLDVPGLTEAQRTMLVLNFGDELAHTNPRFDRVRFNKACGL